MFLKQIILQGFKSFGNRTVIEFDSEYTGIVGPNGCGKSNIIDAIKWVLGEQSAKSMRGSSMSDVVFAGAEGKRAVSMAEVSLVFNNSKRQLNSDFAEIEITRRLYKNTNESEYLINNTTCRLRDIVDLVLDTGLGKDSLSIISQGTVQAFAEAKPIERRALFEEAAGVAKYKKRKIESLKKLSKTQDNIDRLNDILQELEKQVSPLKRQAIKAEEFTVKKEQLTKIEVAVIVHEIENQINDLETIEQQLFDLNYQETSTRATIQILENASNDLKDEINTIDLDVHKLQTDLLNSLNEIQLLEKRKFEVDEKRRYIRETGTTKAKVEETLKALNDATVELKDRIQRTTTIEAAIELLEKEVVDLDNQLSETRNKLNQTNNTFNYLNNRKSVLESLIKTPFEKETGVKLIINNKNVLEGIHDVISNLFVADEGYQQMVSVALASSLYHIITKDEKSARNAIDFLKKNKAGSATFLPLNVLKPRYVNREHLFVAENTAGFVGLASDFVNCDEIYDVVILSLLGNVLVTEDLKTATSLAKRLNYQYKIITIDGDVVYRGGTMRGGYNKKVESPLTYQNQLAEIITKEAESKLEIEKYNSDLNKFNKLKEEAQQKIISQKVSLASLKGVVEIKKEKYEKLKEEYDRIKPDSDIDETTYQDELVTSLNSAYVKKDEITNTIQNKRERRLSANSELQRKYSQLRQVRNELLDVSRHANDLNIEKAKLLVTRDNHFERLARDYQMTYEYASAQKYDVDIESAKEEVLVLRREISELGNINLDAPKDYEEVNKRYTFMNSQLNDLTEAKNQLLTAINEMDEVMTFQFKDMFDRINGSLNEVFTVLFGGGRARLILEDPDDILNTGIDIDVQPPGKSVQNIRLFSGGEKSLIAICVLFAILKARPVPLCIFDEVEASLDQGNVDRFARYIHKFTNQTQFIVITHRPGTMTECDVLYGITMQKQGVSNVIKVKLKEALSYAEEEKNDVIQ
ncbi:MAG: AAA family ATPase [Bacillota bacterium]|jgi:chromosome segregation protein|nr:AAA family ATPase [Bacillota bacterium]NLL25865.1 AAA family ATPase [Erysipelotrichia bacterium]